MCVLEFDDPVRILDERDVAHARRDHVCDACGGAIPKGAPYQTVVYKGDGPTVEHEKICAPCGLILDTFAQKHEGAKPLPNSLDDYLVECLDDDDVREEFNEERDQDERPPLNELGRLWQSSLDEMRARRKARQASTGK